ncbi:PTS fructose-like transporter subunit IIB [Clostridium sp.]|uniref:PTS fructose-like transporter subunit IIB n=1 Tax=Clostridium sp. TaxID=1506 RepID=UPI003F2AFF2A
MKIVAVTACPSGVAHTYMAAESLVLSGKKFGVEVMVETQGGAGIENQLKENDIKEACCVILTNDISIKGEERFAGKTIVRLGVSDLVKKSDAVIKKIKTKFE